MAVPGRHPDPDPIQLLDHRGEDPAALLHQLATTPADDPSASRLRAQVIEAWLPLAERVARRFHGRGVPLEDLVQTARVGLIEAVDRFDPDRGRPFAGFAVPTILGHIRRYFRDRTWDLRVPRRLKELRLAINASTDELAQQLGHLPTTADLAAHLEVPPAEVAECSGAGQAHTAASLDAALPGHAEATLGQSLGGLDRNLALAELRVMLEPALAQLPGREQEILRLRFYANLTQTEIAEQVGVSQMHVSRLLSRSLRLLRTALEDDPTDDPAGQLPAAGYG